MADFFLNKPQVFREVGIFIVWLPTLLLLFLKK
jgi:hypothetical protein